MFLQLSLQSWPKPMKYLLEEQRSGGRNLPSSSLGADNDGDEFNGITVLLILAIAF